MQATLIMTSVDTVLAGKLQVYITKVARQRRLSLHNHTAEEGKLTVHVSGTRADIYVLTNAIASGFRQVQVKLEQNKNPQDVLEAA